MSTQPSRCRPIAAMLALAFLLFLVSVTVAKSLTVHEKRGTPPPAWLYSHRPAPNTVLPLRIGLAQSNMHKLESYLMDVSHPDSDSYGRHWTPKQIADTFAPTLETVEAVGGWLISEGIAKDRIRLSPGRNWLEFNATVEEAEALLDAEYHMYKHHRTGQQHVGTVS